ncbi:MAG: hypothetical protein J6Q85_03015 [Clostridia bacterium]|nr:hypothetical protein [Clostridia bacterium]
MSEAERKRRCSYKEQRKKWILIQGIVLIVVAIMILGSTLIYNQLNKEIYIAYQESSSVKYSVKIPKNAPFYSDYLGEFSEYADENGDLWIPSSYAYPTMAATAIKVDLDYQLNMGTRDVDYEYTYRIYANPEVVDSSTKSKFPMPKTVISETLTPITQSSNNKLVISKPIEIDYHYYDQLVKDFESKLGIKNATENLIITMEVEVIGSSEMFESNAENTYTINVSVPLNENAFDVKYSTSSGQGGDCKILARKNSGNQNAFKNTAIGLGGVELLALIFFIAYVYLTRNHDVKYTIRVERLLNNYRSFIQRVRNGFDTTGYQLLEISTFKEMLAIRDTIQSPILMSENTDQTRTQFFIPTNTKILYVFDIKVDNYDELYGAHPEWTDDSIIKLNVDNDESIEPKDTDSESPVTEKITDANAENQLIANLYSEIQSLRRELYETKAENKEIISSVRTEIAAAPVITEAQRSEPASRDVTINYSGIPSVETIKEMAKMIADDLGGRISLSKEAKDVTVNVIEAERTESVQTTRFVPVAPIKPLTTKSAVTEETDKPVSEAVHEVLSERKRGDASPVIIPLKDENGAIVRFSEQTDVPEPTVEIKNEEPEAKPEPVAEQPAVVVEPAVEEHPESHDVTHHTTLEHLLNDLKYDEEHDCFIDEEGHTFNIQCKRSFTANIIQSDPETVKYYYSELKNYALSFKGVKARMSWRFEAFKKGRNHLIRLKIRGKSICMYCALDPEKFDKTKYFQEALDSKMFECVPMLVKIKSPRGLKRAMELIDATMQSVGILKDPKATKVDYVREYPFESTKALIEKGLIKVLDSDYTVVEPEEYKTPEDNSEFDTVIEMSESADASVKDTTEQAAEPEIEFDDNGEAVIPAGKKLNIHCKRSFIANLTQSDPMTVKTYYSDLKNHILSFKGLKARSAWRHETFKKGRKQLFRVKIRGKGLCMYCALDPNEVDASRYFHDTAVSKDYQDVPTMVKIKTQRGLKRAKELVDTVMVKNDIQPNPRAKEVDYVSEYPFRKTRELVEDGYIKILSDSYKIKEPKAPKVPKAKKQLIEK